MLSFVLTTMAPCCAEPQPQPVPKIGAACPIGYTITGRYCLPAITTKCRAIVIYGIGVNSGTGTVFNSGRPLTVENCVIRNLTGNGIEFRPTFSSRLAISGEFTRR